jgi:4-amino-4-deoxy-L-arabinose transferase-like glycosyltransferase
VTAPGRASSLALGCALILAFCLIALLSSVHKTRIIDERAHIRYGERILDDGIRDARPDDGSSPLSVLNAIAYRWARDASLRGGPAFLGLEDEKVARLPTLAVGAALLGLIWLFASSAFGRGVGLFALLLAALSPTLTAHAKWVTTDMIGCLGFAAGFFGITQFLVRPGSRSALLMVLAVALAQVAKASTLLLFPLFFGLGAIALTKAWMRGGRFPKRFAGWLAGAAIALAAGTLLVVNLSYRSWSIDTPLAERYAGQAFPRAAGLLDAIFGGRLPIADPFVKRFELVHAHNEKGHNTYFLGQRGFRSWVLYFPTVVLIKTPLPLLGLAGVSFALLATRRRRGDGYDLYLLLGMAGLLLFAMFGMKINLGHRHILALYPLLICFAARAATDFGARRRLVQGGVGALAALLAIESLSVAPHHLSYFNPLIGSRCNAWKWVSDSNLNWGQDEWYLREWKDRVAPDAHVNPDRPVTGTVVVDINLITRKYMGGNDERYWLVENFEPEGCITPGWLIYRIPGPQRPGS